MARGEVTAEHSGAYQVGKQSISGGAVDRWRKLASIPVENRLAYYAEMQGDNKRPSRNVTPHASGNGVVTA